jgi:hypothetical protein
MKTRRPVFHWTLEIVSLLAVAAAVALAALNWNYVPDRVPRPGSPAWFSPRTTLLLVVLMNFAAYAGLTVAGARGKLIQIPAELERASPRVRSLLLSIVLMLKTALMLFSAYLVWTIVDVSRRGL